MHWASLRRSRHSALILYWIYPVALVWMSRLASKEDFIHVLRDILVGTQNNEVAIQVSGLDSGSPSIYSELRAINETGALRRQEDNRLGNLVGCGRTARWSLGG